MATRENTSREQLAREAFALVFSDALQARGLTLDRVQARLVAAGCPVSIATLSYWQTGRSLPTRMASMAALAELDRIFELPPGYLVSLLPARTDRSWRLRQVLDSYDRVEQIFAGWGSSTDSQLTSIVVHERHLVQDEGQRIVSRMRQLMRCTGDDVTTTPYIFQQPAAHVAPRPQALTGCEIGNSFIDQDAGLAVGEWVFPRPVQAGELVCFDFEIDWVSSDPLDRCFERLLADQAQILSIQVEFTGRPPARARRQLRANHDTDMLVDEPLPVDGNQVMSLVVDPQPGMHGVRWEF